MISTLGIYAATANLNVTLALAFITFVATHVEGVRYNGPLRYFKSWIPGGVPKFLMGPIAVLETLSQFMRLITLSVRLFANMLAGHMIILILLGFIFIISPFMIPVSLALGTVMYLFEVVIVVTIQAFVFALLSAIYIGGDRTGTLSGFSRARIAATSPNEPLRGRESEYRSRTGRRKSR